MPMLNLANAEPATPSRTPHPGLLELAEGCLRRNPYRALKDVACDCREGVLVLRGCLPTYYLKQVAQEVVACLEGVQARANASKSTSPCTERHYGHSPRPGKSPQATAIKRLVESRAFALRLRAVPEFVSRHPQGDPAREEMTVPVASGELKLVLSWVAEPE